MTCPRCAADPQPENYGSPRRCAFPEGVFVADNWACASMDVVRSREDDGESIANRCDQRLVTLILPSGAFLVLGIYKHRGRTEAAVVIDEAVVRPLTLADVPTEKPRCFRAVYDGTCSLTGKRFKKGAEVYRCGNGYAKFVAPAPRRRARACAS